MNAWRREPPTVAVDLALWALVPFALLAQLPQLAWSTPEERRAQEDTITLADGKELEGRVVYEDERELVLRVGSRDRTIALEDVSSVDARSRHLRAFLKLLATFDHGQPERWADLARSAEAVGLLEEARLAWLKTLALDPEHDDAHRALGHTDRNGKWTIKHGGKYLTWARYLQVHEDWRDAWELETTHFSLKTSMELEVAVDAALDFELAAAQFYDLLATELRIFEITEPMKAEIHGQMGSFRLRTPGERGWFDRTAETLLIDASPDPSSYDRGLLFHEATHELFYFTSRQAKRTRGNLPAWLNEGLAEYIAARAHDGEGHQFPFARRKHEESFRRHAEARKPIELGRLLNLGAGEFSVGGDLAQRYAQCYTLVNFLLEGERPSWRDGFMGFMRSAYASKGSSSHFWKALDAEEEEVEAAWNAHARAVAAGF